MKITDGKIINIQDEGEALCREMLGHCLKDGFGIGLSQISVIFKLLGVKMPVKVTGYKMLEKEILLKFGKKEIHFSIGDQDDSFSHIIYNGEEYAVSSKNGKVLTLYSIGSCANVETSGKTSI